MADVMTELLGQDDRDLLRNAICSVRAMGSIGQCEEELISEEVCILCVYCLYIVCVCEYVKLDCFIYYCWLSIQSP